MLEDSALEIDNQQEPTVWHREPCPIICNNINGKRTWERRGVCICITESLCCRPKSNTTLLINYACYVLCAQSLRHVWRFATSWTIGPSVPGISQARVLAWVATSSSRGSSWPRDQTCISCVSWIAGRFFITKPPGNPLINCIPKQNNNF